jgi:anti-sigma regulatory factor (Ser/Thr protein kinase)
MNLVAEHQLRNDPSEARQIGDWVEDFARRAGLSREVQNALDLALVEWVSNVISYAFDDSREHWIIIRLKRDETDVRVEIEDDGREFNPLTYPAADTSTPLETRPVGGLGIHMIGRLVDAVEYRRDDAKNTLTLVKRLT